MHHVGWRASHNVCSQPFTFFIASTALQALEKQQGSKFSPTSLPSGSILLEVWALFEVYMCDGKQDGIEDTKHQMALHRILHQVNQGMSRLVIITDAAAAGIQAYGGASCS